MKKIKTLKTICVMAVTLSGIIGFAAFAEIQTDPYTKKSGTAGTCPGAYTGYAKMTNSTGSLWVTPPTNTSAGTLTDTSSFPLPYASIAYVSRKSDGMSWCETNTVTFPATNSEQYQLTVYVKSTPPTNGQPMMLQIQWQ